MTNVPKPPKGLHAAGRRLWLAVQEGYELEQHEIELLTAVCRTVDVLAGLAEVIEREGLLGDSSQGQRVHPAVAEQRQQQIVLARLSAALRLPAGEEGQVDRRPQRRMGARGVYGVRAVP